MNEISEFLTSRRARITPEVAGLRVYEGRRRVTGLRREEVAMLAGTSVEYYTQLERGNTHDVTQYRNGTQYFHHELVGDLELSYESFDLAGDIAQTLVVYTAEPGSPSQVALDRLAHGTIERTDA